MTHDLRFGLGDARGPARHTFGMDEDEPRRPLIVAVEDSPDARLFIELSSHAADLTEASDALGWALQPDQGPLADVKRYLIDSAVVSYCRCFLHSNVRTRLADHIEIPRGMSVTHEAIKVFRNQTVAHSQSELAVTYPVGVLDAMTMELQFVSALTVGSTLPESVVRDFQSLVTAVLELLDEVIDPVRARLEEVLRHADPEALVAAAKPQGIDKLADDFQPKSKRARHPTAHTFYWDRDS